MAVVCQDRFDCTVSPSNKATLFAKKIVATLEGWPLTRGRSKCIASSSAKSLATLERVASVESGH